MARNSDNPSLPPPQLPDRPGIRPKFDFLGMATQVIGIQTWLDAERAKKSQSAKPAKLTKPTETAEVPNAITGSLIIPIVDPASATEAGTVETTDPASVPPAATTEPAL